MTDSKINYFPVIWLGCLIGYVIYFLGSTFYLLTIFPIALLLAPLPHLQYRFLYGSVHLFLALLTQKILPFLQIYQIHEISGFESLLNNRPAIIVANHRGKLDGPLLLGILNNATVAMKMKYAVIPLYATFVKKLGFLSLDQYSTQNIKNAINQVNQAIAKNRKIIIFPEGTRSASNRILPFKNFAFRVARDHNLPIIPVVIHSNAAFMDKNFSSFFPLKKNHYTIRCLPPIKLKASDTPNIDAARVRKIIIHEIDRIENNPMS